MADVQSSFQIQAKGKVVMIRPDGRITQTGLAIRDGKIWFFDRVKSEWVEFPTLLSGRGRLIYHILVAKG